MNLYQLSNNSEFLYSPRSWLHVKKKNYKIFYFFLQLLLLPYINFKYLIIIFTSLLVLLESINPPIKVRKNIYATTIFFIVGLLININYTTKNINHNLICNHIIKIQPFNFVNTCFQTKNCFLQQLTKIDFYLSISICRVLIISLIYLYTMKIFLLTTNYEEIILLLFNYQHNCTLIKNPRILFTIVLSSQFFKIICAQIYLLKIAYSIRGIKIKKNTYFRVKSSIYLLIVKNFFLIFYSNIKFITKTLHSRDLSYKDLYLINIYNE